MKALKYLISAVLISVLSSCSSSNSYEPKEISPTSTEFTSGELAKLIEIVDEPCLLSYAEQDGAIATQFIKLKVKLKLKKESPELQKVDAQDIDFIRLLSVAVINLVDQNETKVQDLNVKSEDLLKLKKLLQSKVGTEETITFEGEFHNSDDAPKWFKDAAAFTPYLAADITINNDVALSSESSSNEDVADDETVNESSSLGSEDWDSLLTTYEQYVNKYISLMKKAANGDMDALSEYPSFMEKAEELSNKMENAQGEMSPSQWARYNEISMKMMQAAQD